MSSYKHNRTSRFMMALLMVGGLVSLAASTGCDQLANWASWGGLVNPFYTSAIGLPAYPTLYDPTNIIQDVIAYRGGVMEAVADDFGDFMAQ